MAFHSSTASFVGSGTAGRRAECAQLVLVIDGASPLFGCASFCLFDVDIVDLRRAADPHRAHRAGRTPSSLVIELPNPWMSSRHARIERCGQEWFLEDLGSKNGTYLHGRRITRERLADGD